MGSHVKPVAQRAANATRPTNETQVWERTFLVAGPSAWNSLPPVLQTQSDTMTYKNTTENFSF